jgi:hypothetical protein
MGYMRNEEVDKRARQERLIGALRDFAQLEAQLQVTDTVSPWASEEDARSRLAEIRGLSVRSIDLIPQITEETEITPPPEAGEYARAVLTTIARSDSASRRQIQVMWVEPGQPILGAIIVRTPAVLDAWEFTSMLVQRQRQRFGSPRRQISSH